MPPKGLRLAEMLAGLSLVSDLAMGHEPELAIRTSLVATATARRMGLGATDTRDVLYTSLLQHVGCTAYAHETALLFGDDIRLNAAGSRTDFDRPRDVIDTFVPGLAGDAGRLRFLRMAILTATRGTSFGRDSAAATCEVARETARRLGLPIGVQQALEHTLEGWNGNGGPRRLRGDDIALGARITRVAGIAALFDAIGGRELAKAVVAERSGTSLDPGVARPFLERADELLDQTVGHDPRTALLEMEPSPIVWIPEGGVMRVARAFGDLVDLKSPSFHGHATGVATLVAGAAGGIGLTSAGCKDVEVAALLHDLGRAAVPSSIWELPRRLSAAEWEQVRIHAYQTERILVCVPALAGLATIAGMHHERLDGSGYHRASRGSEITMPARLLAAADAFQAMTQARAHRPALTPGQAAEMLAAEAATGRLDSDAASAVIEAAGQRPAARARPERPAGLSEREVEVLRLVAAGCSNRELARRLSVSPRTAEHHVQHIYTKIGMSSRAAAALFAMEHDLLERDGDG